MPDRIRVVEITKSTVTDDPPKDFFSISILVSHQGGGTYDIEFLGKNAAVLYHLLNDFFSNAPNVESLQNLLEEGRRELDEWGKDP